MSLTLQEVEALKQSYIEYVPNFLEGIIPVVKLVQQGDPDVYKSLAELIEGLEWIIVVASNIFSKEELDLSIDDLNRMLVELSEGLNSKDSVQISDLLEYELKPLIEAIVLAS